MPRKGEWGNVHHMKLRRDWLRFHRECVACGATENLTIDHMIPRALGGSLTDQRFWRTLCRRCNATAGTSGASVEQIREMLKRQAQRKPTPPTAGSPGGTITFRSKRRVG